MHKRLSDDVLAEVSGGVTIGLFSARTGEQLTSATVPSDPILGVFGKVQAQLATTPPGEIPGVDIVPLAP